MNPQVAFWRAPGNAGYQYFFRTHPEWWSVGLCGCAWGWMLWHGWRHGGHAEMHGARFALEWLAWMGMAGAMMLPLVMDRVRVTAERSLWARRNRAIAGFLVGYFGPWAIVGVGVASLRTLPWTHIYSAAAMGFLVAALWQLTKAHRRAMVACHRTRPLAPSGWRADLDCLRFGGDIGTACVRSCWPLMLACAFAGHGPVAMGGGIAVGAFERWPLRRDSRAPVVGSLVLAGCYLGLAVG